MPELSCDNKVIRYDIVRSRRRSLGIEIKPDGRVLLRAPVRASEAKIEGLVRNKAQWILRHLERIASCPPRRFADGEMFLYSGNEFRLRVVVDGVNPHVELSPEEMTAFISRDPGTSISRRVQETLLSWYTKQACEILGRRTGELAVTTGLKPAKLGVRSQLHRWGSCSAKGAISLNWRLVMAPKAVADYVIIHELCHIQEPNHSRRFWNLVETFAPEYRTQRKWLKDNSRKLDFQARQ